MFSFNEFINIKYFYNIEETLSVNIVQREYRQETARSNNSEKKVFLVGIFEPILKRERERERERERICWLVGIITAIY